MDMEYEKKKKCVSKGGEPTPVSTVLVYCQAFDDHDISGRSQLQSLTHSQIIRDGLDVAHLIGRKQCVDVFFVIYPNTK